MKKIYVTLIHKSTWIHRLWWVTEGQTDSYYVNESVLKKVTVQNLLEILAIPVTVSPTVRPNKSFPRGQAGVFSEMINVLWWTCLHYRKCHCAAGKHVCHNEHISTDGSMNSIDRWESKNRKMQGALPWRRRQLVLLRVGWYSAWF